MPCRSITFPGTLTGCDSVEPFRFQVRPPICRAFLGRQADREEATRLFDQLDDGQQMSFKRLP